MGETMNPAFNELVSKLNQLADELDNFPREIDNQGMDDNLDEFRRSNNEEIRVLLNGMLVGLSIPDVWVDTEKRGEDLIIDYQVWKDNKINAEYEITVHPDMSWEKKVTML